MHEKMNEKDQWTQGPKTVRLTFSSDTNRRYRLMSSDTFLSLKRDERSQRVNSLLLTQWFTYRSSSWSPSSSWSLQKQRQVYISRNSTQVIWVTEISSHRSCLPIVLVNGEKDINKRQNVSTTLCCFSPSKNDHFHKTIHLFVALND